MAPNDVLREIKQINVQIEPYDEDVIGATPLIWLASHARAGMFLLLHADDGVFWAKAATQAFQFSDLTLHDRFTAHPKLVQMARLFDQQEEYFLWRVAEGKWQARHVSEEAGNRQMDYFDEPQVLWGTKVEPMGDGFAQMIDGEEGLRHTVPLPLTKADWKGRRHLRLDVRHYLIEEAGWLRVRLSRLCNLRKETKK